VTDNDVGQQAIDRIFKILQIDEEWSIRRPWGFTWWSYRLAQHIDATPPWQDDEYQLSRIRIGTELFDAVNPPQHPSSSSHWPTCRKL